MTPNHPPNAVRRITARRSPSNPLITHGSHPSLGNNVNGPSAIRVPGWIPSPLGRYYLYFAHHQGQHIRMAYADSMHGPWTVYAPGVLSLAQAPMFASHIASPDVHVDDTNRQIRMYFHGPVREPRSGDDQQTAIAFSSDGLAFQASPTLLGASYFRVFCWQGHHYAITKKGNSGYGELLRSPDGVTPFESRGEFIARMRHCAVLQWGEHLLVFYSRKGDAPERILMSTVRLDADWCRWVESEPLEVLWPETADEGTGYPVQPSEYGSATGVCQLRDPGICTEEDRTYLFYTIAGEMGISLAELEIE